VEKQRFLNLVQNFTSLSEEEASELNSLQKDYPYSQVVHNLAARAAQDNQLLNYNHLLNLSAVYSTDRSVLKHIMIQPHQVLEKTKSSNVDVVVGSSVFASHDLSVDNNFHGDDLIHEVETDLARLKELKENFELTWGDFVPNQTSPDEKKKSKKLKNVIISSPDDGLIEQIKNSKKEIDPEGEKQKEQIQIIDNFIKTSPSIPKGKPAGVMAQDLSENSSSFGDNIVSETLVEILLKQGKKDKAIEVLRKLIWKFPQKKAIFAAQIDELKR
jgi:hypothetical protein